MATPAKRAGWAIAATFWLFLLVLGSAAASLPDGHGRPARLWFDLACVCNSWNFYWAVAKAAESKREAGAELMAMDL